MLIGGFEPLAAPTHLAVWSPYPQDYQVNPWKGRLNREFTKRSLHTTQSTP